MHLITISAILIFICTCQFSPSVDLINQKYRGKWSSLIHIFNNFERKNGNLELSFKYESRIQAQRPIVNTLYLLLLDPIYHDARSALLKLQLGQYNQLQQKWSKQVQVSISILLKKQVISSGMYTQYVQALCDAQMNLSIINKPKSIQDVQLHFILTSELKDNPLCQFEIESDLSFNNNSKKIMDYCSFLTVIMLCQLFNTWRIVKNAEIQMIDLTQFSLTTVLFCGIQDFFIGIVHLYFIYQQKNFYAYFIIPIILIFSQILLDYKLATQIFIAKHFRQDPLILKKKWYFLHFKICILVAAYITIMYMFPYQMLIILCQSFVILPQIFLNLKKRTRSLWNLNYIIGYLLIRSILPTYYRGCPQNLYYAEPNHIFCFLWVSIYFFEIGILYIQSKAGGNFFVPKCLHFSEEQNDYYKILESKQIPEQEDCPICLQVITHSINQDIVSSPCKHYFHIVCLKQWLKVKLECPSCRKRLSQIKD